MRAGYETRVLESLRPAWNLLGDVVLEIQVSSWAGHGVQLEEGLSTMRELIVANDCESQPFEPSTYFIDLHRRILDPY